MLNDETIYTYTNGKISKITQRTTGRNRTIVNTHGYYTCKVIGDGTIQHFGTDFKDYKPANIYLKCN